MQFSNTFRALLNEAQFTGELLGSGATQIRHANYATKGIYFQAFTSLSTGLERIGKLCLMLDRYIELNGSFPDLKYLRNELGHNLILIYQKSRKIVVDRSLALRVERQSSSAVKIAEFLRKQPMIQNVFFIHVSDTDRRIVSRRPDLYPVVI